MNHVCIDFSIIIIILLLFNQVPENELTYKLEEGRVATDYFTIHPKTGNITINRILSSDPALPTTYNVRFTL